MTGTALTIDITIEDEAWEAALPDADAVIRRAVEAAWTRVQDAPGRTAELSVVLGDDAMVRTLNSTWRGQDKPTNVLSFPAEDGEPPAGAPRLLGDIVLAYGTVAREAGEQDKTLHDHLSHLCVHGLLHLLGYDHETAPDAAEMEGLEISILAGLGIADPFALPAAEV
jgi:probable rRNA maturation factor